MQDLTYPKYADYQTPIIQETQSGDIIYSSFKLQKNGLQAIGTPTFEEWTKCGEFIRKCEGAVQLWIGDWINYGEHAYGEMYSQAMNLTGLDYQTLADDAYVARKVKFSDRSEKLSFRHHKLVAPLPQEEQNKLLKLAENEKLTVQELNVYIKESKKDAKEDDIDDRKIVPYGENIYFLSTKLQDSRDDAYKIIDDNDFYPTLKRRSWFFHKKDMSEFSLREYARVQEFPDSFKFVGTYEKIKDQIGNAVSPTMAKYIGNKLKGKTFGDLFAGCGGLSCGLEMLGKTSKWAIERCIDYARTYKVNHPSSKVLTRDIKKINTEILENVDIIVGGPPCQGFSLSGIRFKDDPRNQLYKEFVRFVKELKPKEFLLENVAQIQEVKEQIVKDFEDIGYKVETILIKGEEIGMRQHRHRFFFYGHNY